MFEPKNRAAAPTVTGYLAYVFLNVVFLVLSLSLLLLLMWARGGALAFYEARGSDLAIRAVLKPQISDDQANELAARLRAATKAIEIVVVGQREAQTLLSLQEPWMQSLPEVEVGNLPAVLEIRHPATLTNPPALLAYNEKLDREPEVDFVMFNSLGYESLVQAGANLRRYAAIILAMAAIILLLCYTIFNFVLSTLWEATGVGRALFSTILIFTLSFAGAMVLFEAARRLGPTSYRLPGLPFTPITLVAVITFGLVLLLELKNVRFRRRAVRRVQK